MMRQYIRIFRGEFLRALIEFRRYPFDEAAMTFMFAFLFLVIYFFGKGMIQGVSADAASPQLQKNVGNLIAGYLVWLLFFQGKGGITYAIVQQAQMGFLEQLFLTRFKPALLLCARGLAEMIVGLVPLVLVGGTIIFLTGSNLKLDPMLLLVIAGVGTTALGIGLAMGGLVLVFKRIEAISYLATWSLLILTTIPLEGSGPWAMLAKLFPVTQGIRIFRLSAVEDQSSIEIFKAGEILWLGIGTGIFFALGWMIYHRFEKIARDKGFLGQY